MSQTRKEFGRALEAIEAKVTELFGTVVEDVPVATQALLEGGAAGVLAEREQVIDAFYQEAEGLAGRELLLQAPVASDLRFLLSVLRVAPELERSHDLVTQIAAQAGQPLAGSLSPAARGLAERMGSLAADMWREAAHAWDARDRSIASALAERDQEMGQLQGSRRSGARQAWRPECPASAGSG
jgi:phosphate transport system protein